jgi:hypothetical protein
LWSFPNLIGNYLGGLMTRAEMHPYGSPFSMGRMRVARPWSVRLRSYCSTNTSRQGFDSYLIELDYVMKDGRKSAPAMMVAGDFNAKARVWGVIRPSATCLLDVVTKCDLLPIKTTGNYSFLRNGRTSFPDVLCISRRMWLSWRRSTVLDWYSASDHFYIMHVFDK